MLRDDSILPEKQPYSFSRIQLTWWTIITLSSFITIIITKCEIPTFHTSTLILLGISAATSASASAIDVSDKTNLAPSQMSQNYKSVNFLIDILSDKKGVSIHRFQTIVFNLVFGIWFINEVLCNLQCCPCAHVIAEEQKACLLHPINYIIPIISNNNLILLGLSSGTYAALKVTENKSGGQPAVG